MALAIILEVAGTIFLRMSEGFSKKRWIAPVVVAYCAAFACLAHSLREGMAIGVAYGIWAVVGIALTAVVTRLLFNDSLTSKMIAGIGLIIIGVLFVELGASH